MPADSTDVRVAMTENNGLDVIVASSGGSVGAGCTQRPGRAVPAGCRHVDRLHRTGVRGPVDRGVGEPDNTHSFAGRRRAPHTVRRGPDSPIVHGSLTAVYNSLGQARTVNTLPLEQYVADTVPGESPSSWGSLGGVGPQGMNWGFQELEAQAVAVRSSVLADLGGYGGYADTCDLTCQSYRGTEYEAATTTAAASDTAGEVMVMPGGQIATTEYSVSTGGYTSSSNQQSPFNPVPDDGDAVCVPGACNTNHHWSTSVSATTIEAAWPQIGTLSSVSIDSDDPGHPDDFGYGRVDSLTITGSTGSITIPGTEFYVDLGLNSDLFTITSSSSSAVSLTGQGWGHGIGLGQWGALGYAIGQDDGEGNWNVFADRGPLLRPRPSGQPFGRGLQRRRRVLDRRLRRRRLQLRQRAVPREHRGHAAEPAGGGDGLDARRRRLLGGRQRRRGVQLRRRPVPRQHREHPAQQADGRHGGHPRRRRVLAGGLRRRDLRLRRRRVLREHGEPHVEQAGHRDGADP